MGPRELAALLDHPNDWHRLTAARLLYERSDGVDVDAIRAVARNGADAGRLTALVVLDRHDQLTPEDLLIGLEDDSASVRRIAIRLAESRVALHRAVRERVLEIARNADTTSPESLAALLCLAEAPGSDLTQVIVATAVSGGASDDWIRAALLSALVEDRLPVLVSLTQALSERSLDVTQDLALLVEQVAEQIGRESSDAECVAALSGRRLTGDASAPEPSDAPPPIVRARLIGLARGMTASGSRFREWIDRQSDARRAWWRAQLDAAAQTAADEDSAAWLREQALALLEQGAFEQVGEKLQRVFQQSNSPKVRAAAIRAIGGFDEPQAAAILLEGIETRDPSERRAIFEALSSRRRRAAEYLLEQIASGAVDGRLLDASARQRLTGHPDSEVQERARELLADATADRRAVMDAYRPALQREGDVMRGRAVFERHCAACHRVGDLGTAVGPDIADNYNRTREQLLAAILDPNQNVESSYEAYVVLTNSGLTLQGLLVEETAAAITVRDADVRTITVARDDIEQLRPTGISLMPTGIEQDIDVAAMADLLAFLKGWRELMHRRVD
jgi:putative heme-binding domain-containing protein